MRSESSPLAPLKRELNRLDRLGSALLRLFVTTLVALLMSYLGAVALGPQPWGAAALAAGSALVLVLRWGRTMLVAQAVGIAVALWSLKSGAGAAVAVVLASLLMTAMAHAILVRRGFDPRQQRVRDTQDLVLAAVLVCALATPIVTLPALAAAWSQGDWPGWWAHWPEASLRMALSFLSIAVPSLALDHRLLRSFQPGVDAWRQSGRMAAVAAMAMLLWGSPQTHGPVLALALLAPLLLTVALALRGSIVLAGGTVLLAGLLTGPIALSDTPLRESAFAWPGAGAPVGVQLLWWAAGLVGLLLSMSHAARARSRARRWEWALDGSRLGVADWPADGGAGVATPTWRSFSGPATGPWSVAAWLEHTHPDDRATLESALQALNDGNSGRRQVELRLHRGDADSNTAGASARWTTNSRLGALSTELPALDSRISKFDADAWRWYEATLLVIEREPKGRPIRLLATLADVSARREAQDRERMSVALFQHLHEGLLVTDADLRVLDVNPAYLEILGSTRDEVMGTVPAPLRPLASDPVARQQRALMWAALREHGRWRGELVERRRNGENCTLQATISTVRGPENDLRYHVLVISDITEQRVQRERLERQANFDELTRLPNRARLSQLMDDALRAADRDGYLLVVCYLDLDRFKPVNDRYGHAAGDRLLAELAGRLRSALRSRESWTDSAARLGGDEFVLLLRAGTMDEARLAVERVLRVVGQPYSVDPAFEPVQVTASLGATVYPSDHSDADTLLRHADHAMYTAKQAGRNASHFFDADERRRTEERAMAIGRVQEALDQHEFVLFYQPKVQMQTGQVLGFEALLRWEHPEKGLIAPLQFLPLIENTGLSVQIGDWVLAQAIEHLALWRREGLDIAVSVNISARHLQERDFAQRLAELLARQAEVLAPHLELEMLETAAHADIAATSTLLAHCQALGVRFALDDFGTGYSTLTYLKQLPVDVLKIDRSFVHHMLDDAQDRALVEGCIGLARTFGCDVVAEGVESAAQARTLLEMGCTIGQGTGIAAPMRVSQVATWAREYRGMFALAPTEVSAKNTAPTTGGTGSGAAPATG